MKSNPVKLSPLRPKRVKKPALKSRPAKTPKPFKLTCWADYLG